MENDKKIDEKKVEPLSNLVATNVATYGDNEDCIVVETVASFYNFFNFINTPKEFVRKYKIKDPNNETDSDGKVIEKEITEIITMNYKFNEDPFIELVFAQTIDIILDGKKQTTKSKTKLAEFLNKKPEEFQKVVTDILMNSKERGKGLKL